MQPTLYAHPFALYCQKVLIALYENATPFAFRHIDLGDPAQAAELARLWPVRKFPVLVDDGRTIIESTVIIEHLDLFHPGAAPMLPKDPKAALEARKMDRVFDNFVATPLTRIVVDRIRPEPDRDATGVAEARVLLDTTYRWLDDVMADRTWAAGDAFGLGDCAAAPALFYADWVHEISPDLVNLRSYRARLLARPSFKRAVDEARPYRRIFPGGAPDRD